MTREEFEAIPADYYNVTRWIASGRQRGAHAYAQQRDYGTTQRQQLVYGSRVMLCARAEMQPAC